MTYQLNFDLVNRPRDRSFFDTKNFFIFKMNPIGYEILELLRERSVSREDFMEACAHRGLGHRPSEVFLEKCIQHGLLVAAAK